MQLVAGSEPGEIEQDVRALTRCERERPLRQRRLEQPTVSADHDEGDVAAPRQLVDARVRPVQEAYPVPRSVDLRRRLRPPVHEHAIAEKAIHHLHHPAAVKDELIALVEPAILQHAK